MEEAKTRVKFVIFDGELVALFPDEKYRGYIMSYQHIGQHGNASPDLMDCKEATPEEYDNLYKELTEQVGYNLVLI